MHVPVHAAYKKADRLTLVRFEQACGSMLTTSATMAVPTSPARPAPAAR
jgi:hypothetical protein